MLSSFVSTDFGGALNNGCDRGTNPFIASAIAAGGALHHLRKTKELAARWMVSS
jgi:hypothetical protein